MKILIADDDRFSLKLIQTVLSTEDSELVPCSSGDEALRLLTTPPAPEIAILDWMMPGMNGIEVCKQARAIPGLSTYLILLTSRDRAEDLVEIVETSMSSENYDLLKRPDELFIVEKAHRHPRFVEDAVREMVQGVQVSTSGRLSTKR